MSTPDNAHKLTGRHLVLFTDDTTRTDIAALNLTTDLVRPATDVEDTFDKLKCFVAKFDRESLAILRKSDKVELVHEEYTFPVKSFLQQEDAPWGLARLTSENILPPNGPYFFDDPPNGGQGVDIYVTDSGVFIDHDDFGGPGGIRRAAWSNFEVVASFALRSDPAIAQQDVDGESHGTHVAAIAAGTTYGVAKAANIIPLNLVGPVNTPPGAIPLGISSLPIRGLLWVRLLARDSGRPSVLNYSASPIGNADEWRIITRKINNAGIHFVIAAGNEGISLPDPNAGLPANLRTHAIYVGASTLTDTLLGADLLGLPIPDLIISNYGPGVDVFAPGGNILSASREGPQASKIMSGTSMAAPHVSGLIACLISANPGIILTPAQMKARVLELARDSMVLDNDVDAAGTTRRLASLLPI